MLVGENATVVQKCTCCDHDHTHHVTCTKIQDALETRAYRCGNCHKVTYAEVPHVTTYLDEMKTLYPVKK